MRVALLFLAILVPSRAGAADILNARYDARSDALIVDIAYRGTHPQHDFVAQWGPCSKGGTVAARLIDQHGGDAARRNFRVQETIALPPPECRPSRVTLRLGRVSHVTVAVPEIALDQNRDGGRSRTEAQELFSDLDRSGDGYLSGVELQAEMQHGRGWIAIDRDRDARVSREEFQAVTGQAGGGYSARRLIGSEARDASGAPLGVVRDILVNPAGAVTGLVVDGERVPWTRLTVAPRAANVIVASEHASAGGTSSTAGALPRRGEWRASEFLDDVVQLEPGRRYVNVDDLIITARGEVSTVVVDAGPSGAPAGRYAFPWRRSGFAPDSGPKPLRRFDYAALGIAPP